MVDVPSPSKRKLNPPFCVIIITPGNQQRGAGGGRRMGKELQPSFLCPCDINVAAGGHVDFNLTYYYSRIPQKQVADPLGSAKHTLGTNGI